MKIIAAAYVLPITKPLLEKGAVAIEDGRIVEVGPVSDLQARFPEAEVEDFPQCVLMPGLVNAHTQLDLLHADRASSDFFGHLLALWLYRKTIPPATRRQALEEGFRFLLQTGVTCAGDVGHYIGVVPQAANSPLRLTLFPELVSGGKTHVTEDYETAFLQIDEVQASVSDRLHVGLAPYSAYTLSRHFLKIISQSENADTMPIKIHAAETFAEMQFFYESKGEIAEKIFPALGWNEMPPAYRKTPVQHLESIGFLTKNTALLGANHLADPDLDILSKIKCGLIHTPRFNARWKLGHPPLKKLMERKIPIALGTDITGAVDSLSLWDDMRFLRDHYAEDAPSPEDILRMATLNGARVLGWGDRVGSLEADKDADLIAVRFPRETSESDLLATVIDHTGPRDIAAVFIQGHRIKA